MGRRILLDKTYNRDTFITELDDDLTELAEKNPDIDPDDITFKVIVVYTFND